MPIRSTGPISFSDINEELGYIQTRTLSLGDAEVRRLLAGVRTVSSQQTVLHSGNIILYSEQFDNALWTSTQATVQADQTTAPDGTLTADKITQNSSSIDGGIRQTNVKADSAGVAYRHSVYLKGLGSSVGSVVVIAMRAAMTSGVTSITLTADWTRLSTSFTFGGDNSFIRTAFIHTRGTASGATATLLQDQSVFVWGYQITTGSTLQAYNELTRTTGATIASGTGTITVFTTAAATVVAGAISMNQFYGTTR